MGGRATQLNTGNGLNEDYELERADPDSPERCTHTRKSDNQQCPYKRKPNSPYCPKHAPSDEKERIYNYRLTQFKARVQDFSVSPQIKSLREEIGIARLVLENIVNLCKDNTHLLLNSSQISNMVSQIDRLVNSCHKLEISTEQLLDRSKALQLADGILRILSEELDDPTIVAKIASKVGALFVPEGIEGNS